MTTRDAHLMGAPSSTWVTCVYQAARFVLNGNDCDSGDAAAACADGSVDAADAVSACFARAETGRCGDDGPASDAAGDAAVACADCSVDAAVAGAACSWRADSAGGGAAAGAVVLDGPVAGAVVLGGDVLHLRRVLHL